MEGRVLYSSKLSDACGRVLLEYVSNLSSGGAPKKRRFLPRQL